MRTEYDNITELRDYVDAETYTYNGDKITQIACSDTLYDSSDGTTVLFQLNTTGVFTYDEVDGVIHSSAYDILVDQP